MELLISRRTSLMPSLSSLPMQAMLKACLQALLRHEGVTDAVEISLVLCGDDFIQQLNKEYRGQDKPTDVLSFAQEEETLLGDIVISLPTAERQAAKAGWGWESEVVLLAVHGLLHLLGHDDETAAGAAEMQTKTMQALSAVGITPPEGNHPFFVEYD